MTSIFKTAKMIAPLSDKGHSKQASFVAKNFNIPNIQEAANVHITSFGLYRCFINGQRVGHDLMTPGWVCYDDRQPFQTYDVSKLLIAGENRIEIWIADGWFRSPIMWGADPITNCWGDRIAALVSLYVGDKQILTTDDSWKSGNLPILRSGIYFGEIYDATKNQLEDSHAVKIIEFDKSLLVSQECTPVQELEPIDVKEQFSDENGATIYDFGQNIGGVVRISVKGDVGSVIHIEHSEILGPAKEFDNRNLRNAECKIEYTLSGNAVETYQPYFTFQGFRYAKVTIVGNAELVTIHSIPISSVPDATASFKCAEPLVNQLVQNTIWSQRANFIEVPTDCPQRDERLGWTGDAQVFANTALYLADSAKFLQKFLRDVVADQRHNGAISYFSPDPTRLHPQNFPGYAGATGWGDAISIIPWHIYLHTGDKSGLKENFEPMIKWVDYMWSISNGPIVRPPVEWAASGFTFGDWLQPTGDTRMPKPVISNDCAATIYHYISTKLIAKIARLLGKQTRQKEFENRAKLIRDAFAHEYISASGRIGSSDQTTYSLAFLHGLIPPKHYDAARDYFIEALKTTQGKIGTGFIGTPALLPALTKVGLLDVARDLFLQTDTPGWLYQVEQGATTIWERWDAIAPDGTIYDPFMNSYNHYAFGAVCEWLFETVAGFRPSPEQPGFEHIIFEPSIIAKLGPVSATHKARTGEIKVEWNETNNSVVYNATVPDGVSAEFRAKKNYSELKLDGVNAGSSTPIQLKSGRNQITFNIMS